MKKIKNYRLEKMAKLLVELREQKSKVERKERKIAESLIKLMAKRDKKEVLLQKQNRIIKLISPTVIHLDALKVFRMLPLKKFMQVVEVKVEKAEKILGRVKLEAIAEKTEGRKYLRVEILKKSIRH